MSERYVLATSREGAEERAKTDKEPPYVHTHWLEAHRTLQAAGTVGGLRIWRVTINKI